MCISNGGAVTSGRGLAGMEEDNRFWAPRSGVGGGDRWLWRLRGKEAAAWVGDSKRG